MKILDQDRLHFPLVYFKVDLLDIKPEKEVEKEVQNVFEDPEFMILNKRGPNNLDERITKITEIQPRKRLLEKLDLGQGKWLCKGIIVKILDSDLAAGEYYSKKGVVKRVLERTWAEVKTLKSRDTLQVHQKNLTTVVPVRQSITNPRTSEGRLLFWSKVHISERKLSSRSTQRRKKQGSWQ